ncbi:MAG: ABC transporter permease subunit [Haloarculaceae archaeon]
MSAETGGTATDASPGDGALVAVARFEGRNRLTITGVIAVLFALFGGMYVWLGPQLVAGDAMQDLLDAMPAVLTELFGFESLTSMEGLLASEFYTFGWIVGLAGYLAYSAAGTVAGDLRDDRMDTLLAGPVSRRGVLLGKYLALLVPVLALNVVVPAGLYAASVAVGDPLAVEPLVVVHLLSIPYLLLWGAVGLFLGVTVRRGRTAGRIALGLVLFGWIFESVVSVTDYAWLGAVSPMRYFDPPAAFVHGTYDVAGAGLLAVVAVALVAASQAWFRRRDL